MTPNKKYKQAKITGTLVTILSIVVGGVFGLHFYRILDRATAELSSGPEILVSLGSLLYVFALIWIQALIHESGHLVFGLLLGYRFHSFRVGSLMWLKEGTKLKFKRYSLAGTGGQCLMFLPKGKITPKTHLLYHLGGSIFNAICGIACMVGYACCKEALWLGAIFFLTGGMSFIYALSNGIPMRLTMLNNDGHNALSILRDPHGAEAFCDQLRITEEESKGIRMKDMPNEWFPIPSEEAMGNSMVATMGVLAAFRLMEQHKFLEADALMVYLLETDSAMLGYHRGLLTCQRIYIEILRENRWQVLQSFLTPDQKKFMKTMRKNPTVLRTEYALARLSERNPVKAQAIQKEFEALAKVYPYEEDIADERSLMALVDEKAQIYAMIAQRNANRPIGWQ